VPVFINKPLADDMADAQALAAVARETRTPIFSTSALRFDREVLALKARIEQTGPVRVAVSVGYRELMYYGVHAVEMLVTVLGPGVEWVENRTEAGDRDVIYAQYSNGTAALILVLRDAVKVFELTTFGERAVDRAVVADTSRNPMFADETRAFLRMVRTGEVPVRMDDTLEVMRILCAARESGQHGGRRIYLRDLG
jgi:predicted dehydrogenase